MANSHTNFLSAAANPIGMGALAQIQQMNLAPPTAPITNPTGAVPSVDQTGIAPVAENKNAAYDTLLRDMASGGKNGEFDPAAIREAQDKQFPDDTLTPKKMDWGKLIMLMGLKTMAASQPGSTLGGALGAGVAGGYDAYNKEDEKLDERKDKRRMEKMAREKILLDIADKTGDRVFDREKFDFTKDIELKRLAQSAQGQNINANDTISDANGVTYRMNKLTGEMQPVMTPDGKPFVQASKDPMMDYIMKGINSQVGNSMGQITPQQALKNTMDTLAAIKSSRAGGGAPPVPTDNPADVVKPKPKLDAISLLKKNPQTAPDFEAKYGIPASTYLGTD